MSEYEEGRVGKLADSLARHGVDPAVREAVMAGGESVQRGRRPQAMIAWLRGAMERMDEHLDPATRQAVREDCACCLGGERHRLARRIAREHPTVAERGTALGEAKLIVGDHAGWMPDGRLLVRFFPEGWERYRCPCLPKATEPMSPTYCLCCGGHVKHHAGTALGCRVEVELLTSVLASGGTEPCRFAVRVAEEPTGA